MKVYGIIFQVDRLKRPASGSPSFQAALLRSLHACHPWNDDLYVISHELMIDRFESEKGFYIYTVTSSDKNGQRANIYIYC